MDTTTTENSMSYNIMYNNATTLELKYYQKENYNKLRRCKLLLFSHCLGDNSDFADVLQEINKKKEGDTNKILELLDIKDKPKKYINKYLNQPSLTKDYIIEYLERGCLNRAVEKAKVYNIRCVWVNQKFVDLYHSICYKVASNIDSTSSIKSDYLRNKILNNELNLVNVANMTSKELCPKKYEKIDAKMNKRANLERKIKYSELYRCRKCKRNQCTTERRYNRSLDEGVNLTINCSFCGHSWNG